MSNGASRYGNFRSGIPSPTAVLHANPRRGDHRGAARPVAKATVKGYQDAQRASHQSKVDPPNARRAPAASNKDKYRFVEAPSKEDEPRRDRGLNPEGISCMTMPLHMSAIKNSTTCAGTTVDNSKDYIKRQAPSIKNGWHKAMDVAEHAGRITAAGMHEFSITAAEVYQQECRTNDRGDDDAFFVNPQSPGRSSMDGHSNNRNMHNGSNHETNSMVDETSHSSSWNDTRRGRSREPRSRPDSDTRARPNSIHIVKDPSGDSVLQRGSSIEGRRTPPIDRSRSRRLSGERNAISTKHKHSDSWKALADDHHAMDTIEGGDPNNLREARLQLFKMDQQSEVSEADNRMLRTLDELKRQDDTIQRLQGQLRVSTKALKETTQQLEESRILAKNRQFTSTQTRAKAVQEKKKVEDLLDKEMQKNKKLSSNMAQLLTESTQLKVALRQARTTTSSSSSPSNPQTPRTPERPNNAQLVTLRTEVVELRSKLAEMNAANIQRNNPEVERLTKNMVHLKSELEKLRKINAESKLEEHNSPVQLQQLKEKTRKADARAKEVEERLSKQLKEVKSSEASARSELIRVKANMQRLERERQRKRVNGAQANTNTNTTEVDKLNKQLAKAKEDASKVKQQMVEEKSSLKVEIGQLKNEIDASRKRASQNVHNGIAKGTELVREKKRWEKENVRLTREIDTWKEKCAKYEEHIAALESKIKELSKSSQSTGSLQKLYGRQEMLLKEQLLDAQESENALKAELELQSKLKAEAERLAAKFKEDADRNQRSADAVEEMHKTEKGMRIKLIALQHKLADYDTEEKKTEDVEMCKAKEQSYLNEIFMLKSSLKEAENRAEEETFKAEEERRISREADLKRILEIEQIRKDNEQAKQDDAILRAQTAAAISPSSSRLVASIDPTRSTESMSSNTEAKIDGKYASANGSASEADFGPNSKLSNLRRELALARARLARARDDTRVDSAPESPNRSSTSAASEYKPLTSEALTSWNGLSDNTAAEKETPSEAVESAASAVGDKYAAVSEDEDGIDEGLRILDQELQQSSKRLQDANKKFLKLVRASSTDSDTVAKAANLARVIRESSDIQRTPSGIVNEVVVDGSNEGFEVEVTERRYADV